MCVVVAFFSIGSMRNIVILKFFSFNLIQMIFFFIHSFNLIELLSSSTCETSIFSLRYFEILKRVTQHDRLPIHNSNMLLSIEVSDKIPLRTEGVVQFKSRSLSSLIHSANSSQQQCYWLNCTYTKQQLTTTQLVGERIFI